MTTGKPPPFDYVGKITKLLDKARNSSVTSEEKASYEAMARRIAQAHNIVFPLTRPVPLRMREAFTFPEDVTPAAPRTANQRRTHEAITLTPPRTTNRRRKPRKPRAKAAREEMPIPLICQTGRRYNAIEPWECDSCGHQWIQTGTFPDICPACHIRVVPSPGNRLASAVYVRSSKRWGD